MAAQPEPWPRLSRDLEQMREAIKRLQQSFSSFLSGMGLSVPAPGVTQVDGSLIVQNGEAKSGNYSAGSSGWHLGNDGNAEFNSLTLRGGIVGNDALTSPTAPGVIYASAQNFALTTTLTNILTSTITVPAGFTRAAVSCVGRLYAINPNTTGGYDTHGGDYLFGEQNVSGLNGYALPVAVSGSNGSGTNISPFSTLLTGLTPGGTFTVQMAASTNYASWAANASNTVEMSGSIIWFR